MMTRDEFFRALLAAAKEAGADEAEAYFAEDESFRALATKGVIENYAVNTAGGLSLRVLKDGKMGSSFTEALDEEAIPMLVKNARVLSMAARAISIGARCSSIFQTFTPYSANFHALSSCSTYSIQ